jgi:hypothetical protein
MTEQVMGGAFSPKCLPVAKSVGILKNRLNRYSVTRNRRQLDER